MVTGNDMWDDHIADLEKLFQRLSEANITVNLGKLNLAVQMSPI